MGGGGGAGLDEVRWMRGESPMIVEGNDMTTARILPKVHGQDDTYEVATVV